uniref:DNA damage-binding protein 1 n=1 Tax=Spongospora subterranea TaxID=70186 RepID=A0A0H5R6U4_9EUKA|eukprot:CRZ09833.1 hypothetical protein [Spongospora subterranea]
MHLYSLTVKPATACVSAVFGSFSKAKEQEIVINHGTSLSLQRHDRNVDQLMQICYHQAFGCIRCIAPFRLTGADTDYLILGTDSGKITLLRFDVSANAFVKVHEETFGKTGCRRIVPGQYLAVDPNGRAVMIAAVEKQKFVYILTRDSKANLVISSPLEAHKSSNLLLDVVGVDVGFENPLFACLELPYSDGQGASAGSKSLTYYELDLGLNHVTRKLSIPVPESSHKLISVPGESWDGPGGILICSSKRISYHNTESAQAISFSSNIPTSSTDDELEEIIISHATHRQKGIFFFLLQSERGHVFKVSLTMLPGTVTVGDIRVSYFDTLPLSTALCIMQIGFLFVGSEHSNHYLMQFTSIGDVDPNDECNSSGNEVMFEPRALKNLVVVDEIESLAPITSMILSDLAREGASQLYLTCGRSTSSSLRVLRQGLGVTEMAVSDVPGAPCAVWSVRTDRDDPYHRYIVVSYTNATLVLSIGETVEEVSESGFLNSTPTLACSLLGRHVVAQVHPQGIRLITVSDSSDALISQWAPPGNKTIVSSASNQSQIVIAMTGGELAYFELDDQTGHLLEMDRKELRHDVTCLALSAVPHGRQRARYMAVGCFDQTVLLCQCDDPSQPMIQLTVQSVDGVPNSLLLQDIGGYTHLMCGLQNGVLIRSSIDPTSNALVDATKRFLGARPVTLFSVRCDGVPCVMCVSSRTWLLYAPPSVGNLSDNTNITLVPIAYEPLDYVAPFQSEQCQDGVVAISKNTLRIIAVERLGDSPFSSSTVALDRTARRLVTHPVHSNVAFLIEADHRPPINSKMDREDARNVSNNREDEDEEESGHPSSFVMPPRSGPSTWSSAIRIIDIVSGNLHDLIVLPENTSAHCLTCLEFSARSGESFLAVGTSTGLTLKPRKAESYAIRLYRVLHHNDKYSLELLHETQTEQIPLALHAFQGRLLAGCGTTLRLYDIGKARLLRKAENVNFPSSIIAIHSSADRIYVSTQADSVHFVRFYRNEKQFDIVADSTEPRFLTSITVLDYNTIAGFDKFGNMFTSRLPLESQLELSSSESGPQVNTTLQNSDLIRGAAHKLKTANNFHIGDIGMASMRGQLVTGAAEAIFVSTIQGAIMAFVPFQTKEDVDLFSHLEMHMRTESAPLSGRAHLSYRSSYFPVKDCIDLDLCEQFPLLPAATRQSISNDLHIDPRDLIRKIQEQRHRVM